MKYKTLKKNYRIKYNMHFYRVRINKAVEKIHNLFARFNESMMEDFCL